MNQYCGSLWIYAITFGLAIGFAFIYDRLVCGDFDNSIPLQLRSHMVLLQGTAATLSAIPLIILGSVRYEVGVDQHSYTKEFYDYAAGKRIHTDRGFRFLNGLIHTLGATDTALFIVCIGILVIGVYSLGSIFKGNLCLTVALFVFSFHYFNAFSLIAQYTAIGILCFAFLAVFLNHGILGLVLTALAGTMHSSSFLFIPVIIAYLILQKIKKRWTFTCMICALVVVGMVSMKYLLPHILANSRFKGYLSDPKYAALQSTSMIVIGIAVLIFMLVVIAQNELARQDSKILIFFFIQFTHTGLSLIQGDVILLFRLIYYFWFFQLFSIPLFTDYIKDRRSRRLIRYAIPFVYLSWEWFFPLKGNYYYILPYRARF